MVDKRDSYTKEDLEASGRGELFGAGGPPLPAGNMLMMDRVVKLSEDGGTHNKGYVEAELDINPTYGSSVATLSAIRSCPVARARCHVAVGRFLPRLAGRRRQRPRAGRR